MTPRSKFLMVGGALVIAGAAAARYWKVLHRVASTASRMAPALLEHDEFFELVDLGGPDSHFLERHGPMLRACEVLQRAETGMLQASGLAGRPVASTRWLRHSDLRSAAISAIGHWAAGARPVGGRFTFEFDRDVGEGYLKGGGLLIRTRVAIVIIRDGELITAFPSLSTAHMDELRRIGMNEEATAISS